MVKRYLMLEPGQEVFLVFASKREKYDDNVICKCVVKYATVYGETTVYTLKLKSIVAGKRKEHEVRFWVNTFMCENSNIDTGTRNRPNRYPVFTTKEKCLEWLKAWGKWVVQNGFYVDIVEQNWFSEHIKDIVIKCQTKEQIEALKQTARLYKKRIIKREEENRW